MSCNQRRLRMNFSQPQSRTELVSPYELSYTKEQLDMRRKAEILQYSGPQTSIKLNKLTKAERFAQVVRGYSPAQKSRRLRNNQTDIAYCESSMNIVPTTSSDVPGPPMFLYLDKTVPLYLYKPPNKTFNENNDENTNHFLFHANSPINTVTFTAIENPPYNRIGVLEIINVSNVTTTFNITIPYTSDTPTTSMDAVLQVYYDNIPVALSEYQYYIDTTSSTITVENIELYTVKGYFLEIYLQLKLNTSATIYINTTSIHVTGE